VGSSGSELVNCTEMEMVIIIFFSRCFSKVLYLWGNSFPRVLHNAFRVLAL
jgi:hypothetical protein